MKRDTDQPTEGNPSEEGHPMSAEEIRDESREPATRSGAEDAAFADADDPVERLEHELAAANDRWLRAQAELDNFIKRTRRDTEDRLKYATAPLLTDLLGVMDNLQRAIESAEQSPESAALLEGVKMVAFQLNHTLEQQGCRVIATEGEVFDPNRHEAVIMEPSADHEPNTVIRELRRGYQLHDRVLRPPQVVVAAPAPQ